MLRGVVAETGSATGGTGGVLVSATSETGVRRGPGYPADPSPLPSGYGTWLQTARDGFRDAFRSPVPVYVAAHGLMLDLGLWIMNHNGTSPLKGLGAWDGGWYEAVAKTGYEHTMVLDAHGLPQQMGIAYFPLLPMSMRYLSAMTGMSVVASGILISALASLVAAAGIHKLMSPYLGSRTALIVVALWGTVPPAFVQSAVYTESLFTAFSAWALVALVRRNWLSAAVLTVGAGLSRSTAVLMIGIVCLSALIDVLRRRDWRNWRPAAAVLIAPMGFLGYMLFLKIRLGRWDAWSLAEKAPGWDNGFDFGRWLAGNLEVALSGDQYNDFGFAIATSMILGSAVALIFLLGERRLPWQVFGWAVAGALFTLMTKGDYSTKGRYFMPFFPLLVPFASRLRGARNSSVLIAVGVAAVAGAWYGAYFFMRLGPPP